MRNLFLLLVVLLGLELTAPAQVPTGTTYTAINPSPWWGVVPGSPTISTNTTTNAPGFTSTFTATAYTNILVQTNYITTNSGGIVLTNIGKAAISFTNTSVTLNSNIIALNGAKTFTAWVSGVCTNASGTTALNFCYSLSPDGINWSARDGKLVLAWTPVGLTVTNAHTNLDCSSGAFLRLLQVENSDATYSYNVTNGYVLRL